MKTEFRTRDEIVQAFKEMQISRPTFVSMILCTIVSLICMVLPQFSISGVIDVSIFEMFGASGMGYLGLVSVVMYLLTFIATTWPLVAKRRWNGNYFLPAIITSVVSIVIFCYAANQLDAILVIIQGFISSLYFKNIRTAVGIIGIIATIYMAVLSILLMVSGKEACE